MEALDRLPDVPHGVENGELENGLRYYVRRNSKPNRKAVIALAVKVGSILEEEEEQGVAHIVEHLAFRATTAHPNVVPFLEGIGAEFGACQNAFTTTDETVYKLLVSSDKLEVLSQALSVLAEFSSEIQVSAEELDKERGTIMEEWRARRNAAGRMENANWLSMMGGSKYAKRIPIGVDKVIQTVTPEVVKEFYKRWYNFQNMAVIAVGDFSDTKGVVELIKTYFGAKVSRSDKGIPTFAVPSHKEFRISCLVESEIDVSKVKITCKSPVVEQRTVKDYRDRFVKDMFCIAMNSRFNKIAGRKDPPYFVCSCYTYTAVKPIKAMTLASSCRKNETLGALESMLEEIARVRLYGFSDSEISDARATVMATFEADHVKCQLDSEKLCEEYLQHFLINDAVLGTDYKTRLLTDILPFVSANEVSGYAESLRTTHNCVIEVNEPQAAATVHDVKAAVTKMNALEEEGNISPWDEKESTLKDILTSKPNPGTIVQETEYPDVGVTELILSNGMRVCYKCTNFHDNHIYVIGYAYGGLSEISESEHLSCSKGSVMAEHIGAFGYRPSLLEDMLAGNNVNVRSDIEPYTRDFSGQCTTTGLETILKLVYCLFTTRIVPEEEDCENVQEFLKESAEGQERDPMAVFGNHVRKLKYGNSYFVRPTTVLDLEKVDLSRACDYFNQCFKAPSTFTVAIVGSINIETARQWILEYLGGISRPSKPILNYNRDELKRLPFAFSPTTVTREVIHMPMVEPMSCVDLSFPIELKNEETIYAADVYVYIGGKPWEAGDITGDLSISFGCDPGSAAELLDAALDEISRLQVEGPSKDDISAVLGYEQEDKQECLQDNQWWAGNLVNLYQSKTFSGDLDASYRAKENGRIVAREMLTPETARQSLQSILPCPCKTHYTAVILIPEGSCV